MGVVPPDLDDRATADFGAAALRVMLALVAHEPDPAERAARIAILHADGHLPREEAA